MRVLVVTKIFPNRAEPDGATYNRQQLRELSVRDDVQVMATIPWLPGGRLIGRPSTAEIPMRDRIDGLPVTHPRVLYGPWLARPLSGLLYTASLLPYLAGRREDFDVVLGCFAYPDGWAAVTVARLLGVPAVVKVHGSDVNVLGEDPLVVPALRATFARAAAVVGPSQALVDRAIALGANPRTSRMVANGIDRSLFHPRDRASSRAELGEPDDGRPWILFVGRLSDAKGAVDLVEAFIDVHRRHPDARLVLVGGGADEERLRSRVAEQNLPVTFTGFLPPDRIPIWIGACDLLTLPSHAEGTPNVVLEALASGRRVVATDVGGIPAVMSDERLGELVPTRDPGALATALSRALETDYDPAKVATASPTIDWPQSAAALHDVLHRAVTDPC